MKLKTKTSPIPNGFDFRFPQLSSWQPSPSSRSNWTALINEVLAVVIGNPTYARNYSWPGTLEGVEQWVEDYNCKLCVANKWWGYLEGGQAAAIPFQHGANLSLPVLNSPGAAARNSQPSKPPSWFKELGNVARGARTLADWLGEGGKPVENTLAEKRAALCAGCPQNQQGDLTSFFTKPASELIRRQLEERKELKLSTVVDKALGVCVACGCPIALKVHVPLQYIKAHMAPGAVGALDPVCWITKE